MGSFGTMHTYRQLERTACTGKRLHFPSLPPSKQRFHPPALSTQQLYPPYPTHSLPSTTDPPPQKKKKYTPRLLTRRIYHAYIPKQRQRKNKTKQKKITRNARATPSLPVHTPSPFFQGQVNKKSGPPTTVCSRKPHRDEKSTKMQAT